ncbi:FecR domain-containing protein [Reyranella sp.]|uniref:FecR domain-containing protein n=1 Tax=Reyranella sp. TaxID=1929291 RepID=UPI003BA9746A
MPKVERAQRGQRLALLAATAFSASFLAAPDPATAKVGVTSATNGDPLGRPPSEAERILRIGIDIQANELVTTRANDRAHLVFLDGTSLTVGPNAQLTIDRFVYDPSSKSGDLAINATRGVLRIVGGRISKKNAITVTTPSSTIGIRGGISLLDVQPNRTVSTFVFGSSMTVTGAGQTQSVTRPGSQVTTNSGATPGQPTLVGQGSLSGQLTQLEGGGPGTGGSATTRTAGADQAAQTSGFSATNSGQGAGVAQAQGANNSFGSGPGPANRNPNDTVPSAISNAQQVQTEVQLTQSAENTPRPTTTTTGTGTTPTPPIATTPQPSTPTTTVLVTRGRFAAEPRYTGFNNQTLGVTPVAQNNVNLSPTGTINGNGTATINLVDGRSFTVPWQPGGNEFSVQLSHPTLGPLTGTGYVSPTGDFFAYAFLDQANKRVGFVGGTPTTLAQFPTSGVATYTLKTLGAADALPFASPTVANDQVLRQSATTSPLYSAYSPQTGGPVGSASPGPQRSTFMQSTVSIGGVGAGQKSYVGLLVGDYFRDYNNDTNFASGAYSGTYRMGGSEKIGRLASAESTFDTGGGNSVFGPQANTMVLTNSSARTDITSSSGTITQGSTTRTPQAAFDQPYTNLPGSDYSTTTVAVKSTTPGNVGQSRTDQTLTGFVGGIVEHRDASGNISNRVIGGTTAAGAGSNNTISLETSATNNRAAATITISQWDGPSTTATFKLGGNSGASYATSSFIDDKIYALRDRPSDVFASNTTTQVTQGSSVAGGSDVTSRTTLLSYNSAPVAQFFAEQGVTPCACEFMTWGWWSGEVRYNADSSYNPNTRDRLHLATYVAGKMTSIADLNALTGTATFTGHMVGNVQNGVNAYVAAGTYTNQWNFANRNGVATMAFDGATFGGGSTPNTFGSSVSPSINTTSVGISGSNGRSVTLSGAFFDGGPNQPAKGQGGNFAITGTGYTAGGIFAAQR